MIFFVIAFFTVFSLIFSFISEEPWLIVSSFSVAFLSIVLCLRDLLVTVRRIEQICESDQCSRSSMKVIFREPWTSVGVLLDDCVEGLRLNLKGTRDRLEAKIIGKSLMNKREKGRDSLGQLVESSQEEGEAILYNRILDELQRKFRCAAAALVVQEEKPNQECKVYRSGIEDPQFRDVLIAMTKSYFQRGQLECFGFKDEIDNRLFNGGFLKFGFRHTIRLPLEWKEGQSECRAVLLLGYGEDRVPASFEYEEVQEFVVTLETLLEARRQVCRLSAEVTEARNVSRQKSEFMSHLSHDIRSPISNIRSILTLFKLEGFKEDTPEMIDVALSNCDGAGEIVEGILDYSKHKAGKLKLDQRLVGLRSCLEGVFESFAVTAKMKGLSFNFITNGMEDPLVYVDVRQVKRIAGNLISNALKYTIRGKVDLEVYSKDENAAAIRIKDTGLGMTREECQNVFQPFSRFSGKEVEGVGLGLPLTRILVELNGGRIEVYSEFGVGTEFEVCFPIVLKKGQRQTEQDRCFSNKGKILVVDDDLDCVETMARSLEGAGHQVFKCITVEDAISIINFEEPDLVISDGEMPSGGGERLLQFLSRSSSQVPAIVVSGRGSQEDHQKYLHLGAHAVYTKPVEIVELLERLKVFLSCRKSDPNQIAA